MKKIITFLLTLVCLVCLVACDSCNDTTVKDKPNAFITNGSSVYASLSETVDGTEYKYEVTNGELYLSLKKDAGVNTLINMVNTYLLENAKNESNTSYYDAVSVDEIKELIDEDIYGDEEGRADLTDEEKEEMVTDFLETMFVSYGINATDVYDERIQVPYRLTLAQKAYALDVLKQEIKDNDEKYAEYEAMTDEEKAEAEDPVTAPYYAETRYQSEYNNDNVSEYRAIIVTFSTPRLAAIALQAIGVEVNEDGVWADATTHNALTAIEVCNKYFELYSYAYGFRTGDLTVDSEEFTYTSSELSSYNSNVSTRIRDKMSIYTDDSTNVNPDWYTATPFEASSGSIQAYILKLGETIVTAYTDLTDEEKEVVKEKYLPNLYEASLTDTYIATKMAELRKNNELTILDTVLELSYVSAISSYSVEYTKTDEQSDTVVATVTGKEFTADELYAEMLSTYGISALTDKLVEKRFFVNPEYNKYYANGAWIDAEKQSELETAVAAEKTNFESGTYTQYGYDKTTSSWTTFIEASYGMNNDADLLLYFLAEDIATEYTNSLNYIVNYEGADDDAEFDMPLITAESSHLWETISKAMQAKVDAYFSVEGVHLLISSYNSVNDYLSGQTGIDPEEWTEEQKDAASRLHKQVVDYLADSKGTFAEKFDKIVKAFEQCPSKDGTFTYNGLPIATKLISDGGNAEINVSEFKGYGLYVKYENLGTFTNGSMVEAFNDAVKAIWDKDIADDVNDRVTVLDTPIVTQFGYHVYVNLESKSLTDIANSSETEKRYLPTLSEIRTYAVDNTDTSLSRQRTTITSYYKPIADELVGQYFTYAQRFYQMQGFVSSLTGNSGYTVEELNKYIDLYIDYTFESYLTNVNRDYLER